MYKHPIDVEPNDMCLVCSYKSKSVLAMCNVFTARQQSAVLAIVNPSVCPSVCPSHAGTESKRLQLRSWGLHWRIARRL